MDPLHIRHAKRMTELHLEAPMTREPAKNVSADEELWRETLTRGHARLRGLRRVMRLLPGTPRCKICNNPFGGIGGRVCRVVGFTASRKSPHLCALCCEKMPLGGVEIETAILFADIRGSTALAEQLGPKAYAEALNRFYQVATDILVRCDATIDKLIGDEVMAFFVPAFVGRDFKQRAVEAGQALLLRLGYADSREAWLPVGVGIDAGVAFVGNVGGTDYVDFTVVGDPVNMAKRFQDAASPGELLVGETAFAAVADRYANCERRMIRVQGKDTPIAVRSVPLAVSAAA
jgi:adenylate cyclase